MLCVRDIVIDGFVDQLINLVTHGLYYCSLLGRVQAEPGWLGHGEEFVNSVTKLLERLLDYR